MGLGRALLAAVSTAVLVAAVGGCGLGGGKPKSDARPNDPWWQAGAKPPEIAHRVESDATVVTVRVETRSYTLSRDTEKTKFARRAAKIVWRNQRTRIDTLRMSITGDAEYPSNWTRPELERSFGPRPDGLDTGGPPSPLAPGDGPYRNPKPQRLEEAGGLIRDLLSRTASEHFQLPTVQPTVDVPDDECYEGFLGDKATGKFGRSFTMDLELPAAVEAESRLPGLAAYWASLGLKVDTKDLDFGMFSLRGSVPTVGGISAQAFDLDKAPRLLRFSASTACFKP